MSIYTRLNLSRLCNERVHLVHLVLFAIADKPGKPGTPEIDELKADRVALSWQPPKQDGGSAIFNYIVEYRIDGTFQWKQTTESIERTKYTVRKLQQDCVYEFRVYAENKAGVGPASDCTKPTKIEERIGEWVARIHCACARLYSVCTQLTLFCNFAFHKSYKHCL